MNFNLSNEQYYCEYWRQHFEKILQKYDLTKVRHKNNVEIGHYDFATKIGYGFPNCYLPKYVIHNIFKNEPYYPKSISFDRKWADSHTNEINSFINNRRTVLKNNFGVGSKNIFPVYSAADVLAKMNHRDMFVLQEEVRPLLHNGHKLDERVYLLIVKEGAEYSGYLFQEGHVKLAGFKFSSSGTSMGSFATNIKAPKPKGANPMNYTIDTTEFMEKHTSADNWRKWSEKRLEIMKKVTQKIIPFIRQKTTEYYRNRRQEPKFLWHLYGLDLLIDDRYNLHLCEFNGKPGVVYDKVMPREITNINRRMCDRIFLEFIARWIVDMDNRHYNDKTIVKLI